LKKKSHLLAREDYYFVADMINLDNRRSTNFKQNLLSDFQPKARGQLR